MELQNKPADPIGEVIQRLANAEEAYRIDPIGRFGVCRPEPDEFQRLENVVALEDAVQIARLFHRWSLTARAARLGSWYSYLNLGPITFSVAHEELRRAIESPMPLALQKVETALSRYRDTYQRLSRQLRSEAERTADVDENLGMLAKASSAEAFFEADLLVKAAEFIKENETHPPLHELRQQSLQQQMRYLNLFHANRTTRKRKR